MLGGKGQNQFRSVALGTTVDNSTSGQTIPLAYGLVAGATAAIWMANIRQQSSKKAKKGKGTPDYVSNVDFLYGHNPILGVGQGYVDQNQWLILAMLGGGALILGMVLAYMALWRAPGEVPGGEGIKPIRRAERMGRKAVKIIGRGDSKEAGGDSREVRESCWVREPGTPAPF